MPIYNQNTIIKQKWQFIPLAHNLMWGTICLVNVVIPLCINLQCPGLVVDPASTAASTCGGTGALSPIAQGAQLQALLRDSSSSHPHLYSCWSLRHHWLSAPPLVPFLQVDYITGEVPAFQSVPRLHPHLHWGHEWLSPLTHWSLHTHPWLPPVEGMGSVNSQPAHHRCPIPHQSPCPQFVLTVIPHSSSAACRLQTAKGSGWPAALWHGSLVGTQNDVAQVISQPELCCCQCGGHSPHGHPLWKIWCWVTGQHLTLVQKHTCMACVLAFWVSND